MKAALELGRWVFLAPIGYLNAPRATGKSLMHDPDRAPLVRRAFEEYATGRYTKQQILDRVTAAGLRNRRGRALSTQAIGMLLRNQLYAGVIDVREYAVRDRCGVSSRWSPRICFTASRRCWRLASRARRGSCGAIRVFRFANSCAARSATRGSGSPVADPRAAATTTRTNPLAHAAAV
jgi:hypothetical protein